MVRSHDVHRHGDLGVQVSDATSAGVGIDPLRHLRLVLARLLFNERGRRTVLLLAHLLLLHDGARLLRLLTALL